MRRASPAAKNEAIAVWFFKHLAERNSALITIVHVA